MGAAFTKVLDIAERLGDAEYQLRALSGLNFYHTQSIRYRAALPFAQRFHDLATKGADSYDRLFGERMMGVAKHFLGNQISARRHLEKVLTHDGATDHRRDFIGFQTDLRVSGRVFLARVLWLLGYSDQAVRTAKLSLSELGKCLPPCTAGRPLRVKLCRRRMSAHKSVRARQADVGRRAPEVSWVPKGDISAGGAAGASLCKPVRQGSRVDVLTLLNDAASVPRDGD